MEANTQAEGQSQGTTTLKSSKSVFDSIKDRISSLSSDGTLVSRVVSVFVDRELDRRTKLLTQGLEKIEQATSLLKSVDKPDDTRFTITNGVQARYDTYSQKRLQEIEKARKTLNKLEEVLVRAITHQEFDAFEKELKNVQQSGKQPENPGDGRD